MLAIQVKQDLFALEKKSEYKLSWAEPHSSFPLILQTKLIVKISRCGSENIWGPKNLDLKKCWVWKNDGSEKNLGLKIFGSEKIVGPKKKIRSAKFGSYKFWVKNN